jgi:hypothetical protein
MRYMMVGRYFKGKIYPVHSLTSMQWFGRILDINEPYNKVKSKKLSLVKK